MTRELALLPAALAAWAAAWWVTHSTTHWWVVIVATGGLVAAGAIMLALRRGRVSPGHTLTRLRGRAQAPRTTSTGISAAVALVAVVLVVCSALLRAPVREPEILVQLADRGASVQLTATLTGQLRAGDSTVRAVLDSVAVGAGAPVRLSSPVTVFLDGGSGAFDDTAHGSGAVGSTGMGIGAVVALRGELSRSPPGEADAFLVSAEGALQLQGPPPALWDWANALRAGLSEAANRLPGEGGALLPGLAVGDTGAVSDDLDQAMKDSSLSHLTAVSGANCAIVVAAVMGLCALCGARRSVRLGAGAVALLFFVVLVTPDGSVLRASVMASVWILASGMNRGGSGLSTLALAVLTLLVNDPWLASNYGFILSALATAGLLVLTRPLSRVLARVMPVPLAAALAIPLAAQVACQPVLILLSPSVSAYSVPANLLAAPAAPVATIVGMLACVALPLLPWLGTALLWVGWLPATWIAGLAHFWAGQPGALVPWPAEGWGFALAVVVIAAGLWLLIGPRNSPVRRRTQAIAFSRRLIVIVAVVGGSIWGGTVAGGQISRAGSMPDQWFLAACDVGQGDALILRSDSDSDSDSDAGSNGDGAQVRTGPVYIGVDTGPDPEAYEDCLAELGIQRLDLLILSHFDADHVGGVDTVMGRVDSVLAPPAGPGVDGRGEGVGSNPAGLAVLSSFERSGAEVDIAARGDAGSVAGWAWQVLWPKTSAVSDYGSNDQSVTVRAENAEGNSILFTGDLSEEGQQQMMAGVTLAPVQILKVAHHGSADQSPVLYRKAMASVGVISVGADNTYGHPRDSLLDTLRAEGTAILRTDTSGLILLANTGAADGTRVLQIWSER